MFCPRRGDKLLRWIRMSGNELHSNLGRTRGEWSCYRSPTHRRAEANVGHLEIVIIITVDWKQNTEWRWSYQVIALNLFKYG